MPINNFNGKTFVAFIDISGFKELMKNGNKAWDALDKLYKYGYKVIKENNQHNNILIEGLFISDSGIFFVRNFQNKIESLKTLLNAVKEINKRMLDHDLMLTTSIAYGHFKYEERIEFEGIEKNPIYGNAYVAAFLDNENGKPKIQQGQCSIIKESVQGIQLLNPDDRILRMIRKRNNDNKHYYFYWMIEDPSEIDEFEEEYSNLYKLKYTGMLEALKRKYPAQS